MRGRTRQANIHFTCNLRLTWPTDLWILTTLSCQFSERWLECRSRWRHGRRQSSISSMIIASSTLFLMRLSLGSQSSSHSLILTGLHSRSCSVSGCLIILMLHSSLPCPYLAKIATAASANIFANKEYEMLLRSLNVRRLSFTLLAGENNHFSTHLPGIQEKLVDILRNISSPTIQSEVFLCVRVLLCRLSKHNLTSFWPVLLTELVSHSHSIVFTGWLESSIEYLSK